MYVFEQSHNFAYWMQWGYARSEVRTWAHEIIAVLTRLFKNVFMRRFCFDALKIFFPCQELFAVGWIRLSRIHVLKWVNTIIFRFNPVLKDYFFDGSCGCCDSSSAGKILSVPTKDLEKRAVPFPAEIAQVIFKIENLKLIEILIIKAYMLGSQN